MQVAGDSEINRNCFLPLRNNLGVSIFSEAHHWRHLTFLVTDVLPGHPFTLSSPVMTLLIEPHLHLSPPSPVLLYSLLILKIDATLLYFLVLLSFHWLVSLLLVSIFF